MKIAAISVFSCAVDLAFTFQLSMGRTETALDTTIVRIETDGGLVGWGEVCPFGRRYSEAFAEGARTAIAAVAPALLGADPRHIACVIERMNGALLGHLYAKSALEMACWDLLGKATGLPLFVLLGGRLNEWIPVAAAIHSQDLEGMIADIRRRRAEGYTQLSPKVDGAKGIGEFEKFRAIAAEKRPHEIMTVDANTSLSLTQASQLVSALRGTDVMLEQPCRTYEACRSIRSISDLPLVLDECIESPARLYQAIADGTADALNLKISRIGGLSLARHMVDVCCQAGLGVWIEDTAGTVITAAAIGHLATATPSEICLGAWYPPELTATTVAESCVAFDDGHVCVERDVPGLGVEPDATILGEPLATTA